MIMDLQALFTEAVQLHSQGHLEEAKLRYEKILNELPGNINVLGNLGIVCRDLGQLDEAMKHCGRAVELSPQDPTQHINLGAVCEALQNYSEAKECYEAALKLMPTHPKALNNLGKIYHIQGDQISALSYLEKAVQIEPNYPLALNNIGVILSERGDLTNAAKYLEKSYSLDQYNPETLYNLAGLYNALAEPDKAVEKLEALLKMQPDHAPAKHMLAAVSGKTTDTAPAQYITETFDRYAHRFDTHIQGPLQYDAPYVLAVMLGEAYPDEEYRRCLDLGCGTGLSGDAFKQIADKITGVDLSPQMLAKAREKNIYDRLECEDVYAFLDKDTEVYELILATDVLVYLGRLDRFFQSIAKHSKAGTKLVCSIERENQKEDYVLRDSGRYAHNPDYLVKQAITSGFSVRGHRECGIRKESDNWIPGDLYVLEMG